MRQRHKVLLKLALGLAGTLALATTFAWYFHGFVSADLTRWWATCLPG